MPRRARLHRYPLLGRFAALARKEEHLWSIRPGPVRRAFYGGSVLSLLPFIGIQLPLGLLLAVVLRANFMVVGLLQLITNPFTVVPIYGATFVLGRKLLTALGFEMRGTRLPEGWQEMSFGDILHQLGIGTAFGQALLCLLVGGVVAGLALGAVFDAVYWLGVRGGRTAPPPNGQV